MVYILRYERDELVGQRKRTQPLGLCPVVPDLLVLLTLLEVPGD